MRAVASPPPAPGASPQLPGPLLRLHRPTALLWQRCGPRRASRAAHPAAPPSRGRLPPPTAPDAVRPRCAGRWRAPMSGPLTVALHRRPPPPPPPPAAGHVVQRGVQGRGRRAGAAAAADAGAAGGALCSDPGSRATGHGPGSPLWRARPGAAPLAARPPRPPCRLRVAPARRAVRGGAAAPALLLVHQPLPGRPSLCTLPACCAAARPPSCCRRLPRRWLPRALAGMASGRATAWTFTCHLTSSAAARCSRAASSPTASRSRARRSAPRS